MSMKDVIDRVNAEGAFRHWRLTESKQQTEGTMTMPQLGRNAQGLESYAQMLKRHVADGSPDGAAMAMQGIIKHLVSLSAALAPDAMDHLIAAADRCNLDHGL